MKGALYLTVSNSAWVKDMLAWEENNNVFFPWDARR